MILRGPDVTVGEPHHDLVDTGRHVLEDVAPLRVGLGRDHGLHTSGIDRRTVAGTPLPCIDEGLRDRRTPLGRRDATPDGHRALELDRERRRRSLGRDVEVAAVVGRIALHLDLEQQLAGGEPFDAEASVVVRAYDPRAEMRIGFEARAQLALGHTIDGCPAHARILDAGAAYVRDAPGERRAFA